MNLCMIKRVKYRMLHLYPKYLYGIHGNTTKGRGDTIQEVVEEEVAQEEEPSPKRVKQVVKAHRQEVVLTNETSCISPFFVGMYSSLGFLIVIMIGLNFWFGFHLLFFIGT